MDRALTETVQVPLRDRDGSVRAYAVVDAADAERVLRHCCWRLEKSGYVRGSTRSGGRKFDFRLHRFVLGLVPGDGLEGDHINGDRLDNRRSNLRICTHALNQQNKPRGGWGKSKHRGVYWHGKTAKWRATAQLDGRSYHLGLFEREEDAAAASAAFRAKHMPFSAEAAA